MQNKKPVPQGIEVTGTQENCAHYSIKLNRFFNEIVVFLPFSDLSLAAVLVWVVRGAR